MKLKRICIQAIYSLGHQDEHKCFYQAKAHLKNKEIKQKKGGFKERQGKFNKVYKSRNKKGNIYEIRIKQNKNKMKIKLKLKLKLKIK